MATELSDVQFRRLSRLIYQKCGINLHEGKRSLLQARLAQRLRRGGFSSFKEYYDLIVKQEDNDEIIHLLDSVSTNLTFFFREAQHFEFLRDTVIKNIEAKRHLAGPRRISLWSAGCSSGEEPYSMAITVLEALKDPGAWRISILGSDLSTRMLQRAEKGIYPMERIRDLPLALKRKYFQKGVRSSEGLVRVKPEVRALVNFSRINLIEPFTFEDQFDVIFCRNVMIYFDKPTQEQVIDKLYACLREGGYLFIGHSESLTGVNHCLQYVMPSVYQRPMPACR